MAWHGIIYHIVVIEGDQNSNRKCWPDRANPYTVIRQSIISGPLSPNGHIYTLHFWHDFLFWNFSSIFNWFLEFDWLLTVNMNAVAAELPNGTGMLSAARYGFLLFLSLFVCCVGSLVLSPCVLFLFFFFCLSEFCSVCLSVFVFEAEYCSNGLFNFHYGIFDITSTLDGMRARPRIYFTCIYPADRPKNYWDCQTESLIYLLLLWFVVFLPFQFYAYARRQFVLRVCLNFLITESSICLCWCILTFLCKVQLENLNVAINLGVSAFPNRGGMFVCMYEICLCGKTVLIMGHCNFTFNHTECDSPILMSSIFVYDAWICAFPTRRPTTKKRLLLVL